MSIKKIFKDGRAELKRKSSLRSSKKNLAEKEKTYQEKLTALGKKARDAKLDISQFGDLSGTFFQIEGKGKEIGAKLNELNKQTAELEGKKKAANAKFDALWKDLETKKKPVDSELRSEKDKLEKAQKEADSIQKRLKNIPDEEDKIEKKIPESQGNAQSQAELEKKLTALNEERKQLDAQLPELTKINQAAREKITPLDQQSGRLEAEMKKAKDQRKKEIEDLDKTLSKVKEEINEFNKQQKVVSGQQVQNFQALGKKLSEANVADPAIAAEMDAAKAGEKEMASIRAAIQSLESQKAPGARGAVWKMAGLMFLFLAIIAAIAVGVVFLSKHKAGKKGEPGKSEIQQIQTEKVKSANSEKAQKQENTAEIHSLSANTYESQLTQEELNQIAGKIERLFAALEELNKDIPRDSFDPQAIVDKVGKDPEALFKWVRDNTYLVPYQGILRGPKGVLMDGLGNSLDRALLLQQLLVIAGYHSRIARGTLDDNQASRLYENLMPAPVSLRLEYSQSFWQEIKNLIKKYAEKYQLDESKLIDGIIKNIGEQEVIERQLEKRVEEQTAEILMILKGLQRRHRNEEKDSYLKALKDHWWIQLEQAHEWMDLDPSLPDLKIGEKIITAARTYESNELEKNLFHRINIKISIEQWQGKNFEEKIVFSHSITPSELMENQIVLRHIPLDWPEDWDPLKGSLSTTDLKNVILKASEWLPYLMIGTENYSQASFTTAGEIIKTPRKKTSQSGPGGLTGGFFRALAGEESKEETKKEAQLTGEWIDFEILAPGSSPRRVRRKVFDFIDSTSRRNNVFKIDTFEESARFERGLSLLGEIKILPLVCNISPSFYAHLTIDSLLHNRVSILKIIREYNSIKTQDVNKLVSRLKGIPGPEYKWAMIRTGEFDSSHYTYVDQINIISLFKTLEHNSQYEIKGRIGLDIIANEVGVNPRKIKDIVPTRIKQGIIDTNVEAMLFAKCKECVENTSEIFIESKTQEIGWLLIQSDTDANWQKTKLGREDKIHIEEDLKAGYIVVVPDRRIEISGKTVLGWWRLDPNKGHTLGMGESGKGQGLSEYILEFISIASNIHCWLTAKHALQYVYCGIGLLGLGMGSWIGRLKTGYTGFHPGLSKITAEAMMKAAQTDGRICHLLGILVDTIAAELL